jgi:UDPglucose--hexose-1-phosphate uridylyltransferase
MLNADSSQKTVQAYLDQIHQHSSFASALEALYEWERQAGYITESKLHDNIRYEYRDPTLGITFKTQINIARSRYSPTPLSATHLAPLHCPICIENVGFPGKENLRIFEFKLRDKPFFAQLTPFPLYPKHFVLVSRPITPMIMSGESIQDMLYFLNLAPSYSVFSNSDVEWAGASILSHHHYQAIEGLKLPITEARYLPRCTIQPEKNTTIGLLEFPIAACLIQSSSRESLLHYGSIILNRWRSQNPTKNTCNLALHQTLKGDVPEYFLYLIFRNPDYRTPSTLTHIKSEGVGIIEVCGEGIYPVPTDPKIAEQINTDGLTVIKGIIAGNSPVDPSDSERFFEEICKIDIDK